MENKTEGKLTIAEFIKQVKQGAVARELIPMGMNAGWPFIVIRNKQICVGIPYFRADIKPNDGTELYPISHCLLVTWPTLKVVGYTNLRYDRSFKDIRFNEPVGTFRHPAVQHLSKTEYLALRDELYGCYDELIDCIACDRSSQKQARMKELLQQLMEPSLRPMYISLCKPFYESYLNQD